MSVAVHESECSRDGRRDRTPEGALRAGLRWGLDPGGHRGRRDRPCRSRLHGDAPTRHGRALPTDDHALVGVHTGVDDALSRVSRTRHDGAPDDAVVTVDDANEEPFVVPLHGSIGYDRHVLVPAKQKPRRYRLAGEEVHAGIRDDGADEDRPVRHADLAAEIAHASGRSCVRPGAVSSTVRIGDALCAARRRETSSDATRISA